MSPEIFTLVYFATFLAVLITGHPVAFIMGSLALAFGFFMEGTRAFFMPVFSSYGYMSSYLLVAIPLFIYTGVSLQLSGVAERVFRTLGYWIGDLRGGLAVAAVLLCGVMAAMVGTAGPGIVAVGLVAIPAMLRRNYDRGISLGCIGAGGTLGILIPPSVPMVLFALQTGQSVGHLFAGGVFPGILLIVLYCAYILIRSAINPNLCPAIPKEDRVTGLKLKIVSLREVLLPVLLVLLVLGTIFAGVATPTEAAGLGAAGSVVCAIVYNKFSRQFVKETALQTLKLTAMVMWIVIGASCFVAIYTGIGGAAFIEKIVVNLPVNRWFVMIVMQLSLVFLGCFLDAVGIILLCAPIYTPLVVRLGFDPIWFGVLFTVNLETAFVTPPFGLSLFYLKSIAPDDVKMTDVYRACFPFFLLQLLGLVLCMIFPQIVLWLPNTIIR